MLRLQKIFVLTLIIVTLVASSASARMYRDFTHSSKGKISEAIGGGYNVEEGGLVGWGEIFGNEARGYYSFDTSSMDDLGFSNITKVEFFYGAGTTMIDYPAPDSFTCELYVGTFMEDGLDEGDWNAGDYAATKTWMNYLSTTWIDLGQAGIDMFYNFEPGGIHFAGPENYSISLRHRYGSGYLASLRHGKLRVTFANTHVHNIDATVKSMATQESTMDALKALYR